MVIWSCQMKVSSDLMVSQVAGNWSAGMVWHTAGDCVGLAQSNNGRQVVGSRSCGIGMVVKILHLWSIQDGSCSK